MHKNKIWLSSPYLGGNELKYVQGAFDTNWIASVGDNIDRFEGDLEAYLGDGYATVLNSGTAAIHLGLILLGVQPGDEVLCQSLTFAASANPILYLGATPIFIDSEIQTWNICPVALEEAIIDRIAKGKRPKVIIAVDLYGMPYQVEAVRKLANQYAIPILEDSAEALGSSYKGKKCGTFGDISVLSFNNNKIITTSGGGAIITKKMSLKEKAFFLATQSQDKGVSHYQHSEIGYNYKMNNISAGIGRGQMEVLDINLGLRKKVHQFYLNLFKNIAGVTVFNVPTDDYCSNHWLTTILIETSLTKGISREDLRLALLEENIESRPVMKPMHLQPIFKKYSFYGGDNAGKLFENGLCLPSGSNLSKEERDRIETVILNLFKVGL
ncbi:aminotransferase class I/II-fold pyridoxal phosphate-dependent enzyme [Flavobacterium sp. FBOR7N2.3]|uniref:Aminotransferase class I/II-fold pyridoxal phosphate-dependent enzyme n=1 Tax=Flavobacterium magnesitis TaxID=3138077 RepID=A0ABV4TFT8_9FLAO